MNDFLDFPTLVAIGVAIVVLLRLRSVLGTRTGSERQPRDKADSSRFETKPVEDNVVLMKPRPAEPRPDEEDDGRRQRKLEAEIEQFSHGDANVAAGLRAIAEADAAFLPKPFLEGAKSAYEMIVTAFAQGDRKILKSLLEKDVYDGFEAAITERESEGHKVDFTFVGLPGVEISEAEADKRSAMITIQFRAEVVSATRTADGTLVDGNGDEVVNISDEWTFSRPIRSRDPNWKLVATNQLD